MLGITTTPDAAEMMQIGSHRPSSCTVKNSIFKYADSHAIEMNGQDNRIENCLFRYIDWSASEIPFLMATIYMRGSNAQFVRNTVHHTGASQVMNFYADTDSGMLPPLVEYNRFYRFGLIRMMAPLFISPIPRSRVVSSAIIGPRFASIWCPF